MSNHRRAEYEPVSRTVIESYNEQIKPNVYIVIHMRDTIRIDGETRFASLEYYERDVFEFVSDISRKIRGKGYSRAGMAERRLANFATLEKKIEMPHVNLLMNCPSWLSFERLRDTCETRWKRSKWMQQYPRAFYCEARTGDCLTYSFKEGAETLLERSLSFHSCRVQ